MLIDVSQVSEEKEFYDLGDPLINSSGFSLRRKESVLNQSHDITNESTTNFLRNDSEDYKEKTRCNSLLEVNELKGTMGVMEFQLLHWLSIEEPSEIQTETTKISQIIEKQKETDQERRQANQQFKNIMSCADMSILSVGR